MQCLAACVGSGSSPQASHELLQTSEGSSFATGINLHVNVFCVSHDDLCHVFPG